MPTLNVSLPEQLKVWVTQQVDTGQYASASDYLRDLIRENMRHQANQMQWLKTHLTPLLETPDDQFRHVSATEIKKRARQKIKE